MPADDSIDRRRLLELTGTALAATVGVAGTAAAAPYRVGDAVKIRQGEDVWATSQPCASGTKGPLIDAGRTGFVTDVHDCPNGQDVKFGVGPYPGWPRGWVSAGDVEPWDEDRGQGGPA